MYFDARGFVWRAREIGSHENDFSVIVTNPRPHTLRGIHYQEVPHACAKIVRVISGAVRLVIVNLATGSHTNDILQAGAILPVEKGFGVGYLTLLPNTVLHYEMNEPRVIEAERGLRWDDPALGIDWGVSGPIMNKRDRTWPDWSK